MAITTSLHELSVEEGFVNNVSGMRVLRVGVDARYVTCLHPSCRLLTESKWLDFPCVLFSRGDEESRISNTICLVHAAAADAHLTLVHIRWERTPEVEAQQNCSRKCTLDHPRYESNA